MCSKSGSLVWSKLSHMTSFPKHSLRKNYVLFRHRYHANGMLEMVDRNRKIKLRPERFQDEKRKFDVVVTCEERVFDQVAFLILSPSALQFQNELKIWFAALRFYMFFFKTLAIKLSYLHFREVHRVYVLYLARTMGGWLCNHVPFISETSFTWRKCSFLSIVQSVVDDFFKRPPFRVVRYPLGIFTLGIIQCEACWTSLHAFGHASSGPLSG